MLGPVSHELRMHPGVVTPSSLCTGWEWDRAAGEGFPPRAAGAATGKLSRCHGWSGPGDVAGVASGMCCTWPAPLLEPQCHQNHHDGSSSSTVRVFLEFMPRIWVVQEIKPLCLLAKCIYQVFSM